MCPCREVRLALTRPSLEWGAAATESLPLTEGRSHSSCSLPLEAAWTQGKCREFRILS